MSKKNFKSRTKRSNEGMPITRSIVKEADDHNEVYKSQKEDSTMMKNETKSAILNDQNYAFGQLIWINNSQLHISPDIQRRLDPIRVAEIASSFSPVICNPVKVNYRDGKYYVFDGMHTRAALMVMNSGEDFPVMCRVYTGLTKEDEAQLFAVQFGASAPVSMIYRLRALEVAKDPVVLEFLRTTRSAGFSITLGDSTAANGNIAAVCTAYTVYGEIGKEEYKRMLTILHRTWAGESWSVNKFMLGGMARFLKMYEVEEASFVSAFREVTQDQITDEVRRFRGMTKDGAYAAALAEIYERGSKTGLKAKKADGKAVVKAASKTLVKSPNRSRR